MKKFVGLAASLAVACFMALPTPAAAQCCGRYYRCAPCNAVVGCGRCYRSDCCYSRGFGRFGWRRACRCADRCTPCCYTTSVVPCCGSNVVSSAQAPTAHSNAVAIKMHVPEGARVWIEGDAISQSGQDRKFVSPPITPGRDYVYHIRVQWDENNKTLESTREVSVHAGDQINLSFGS